MNWYYLNGEKRSGPFSASTLREMRACGILADETMVSKEGKDQWQPYVKAFPPEAHQQDSAAPPIPSVLKFECPHCQQHISADSSQAGISAQCPACAGEFVVPKASQEFDPTNSGGESNEEERSTSSLESQRDDAASRVHHCGPVDSIGERVKNSSVAMKKGARIVKEGAQIGWAGLKRRSKQAALKAQIEKLRNIDLRKAYHALGRSAFEQCILADEISDHFQTVHDLDAKIAALREKGTAEEGETKMAALKRMGKDTAKAGQAQALTVKREHSITELGRAVYTHKDQINTQDLNDKVTAITNIQRQVQEIEEQIRALEDGGKSGIQTLAVAAIGILLIVGVMILWSWSGSDEKYSKEKPFVNSLGMKFVPVPITGGETDGQSILFCVWETRRQDYRKYSEETPGINQGWENPEYTLDELAPVIFVTMRDAMEFCRWLTEKEKRQGIIPQDAEYRLPTDHEWSCAVGIGKIENPNESPARKNGKIRDVYPWGTVWPMPKKYLAEYTKVSPYLTIPVGSLPPNEFGLYDLEGNVSELCMVENGVALSRGGNNAVITMYLHATKNGGNTDEEFELFYKKSLSSSGRFVYKYYDETTGDLFSKSAVTSSHGLNDCGFRCVLVFDGVKK